MDSYNILDNNLIENLSKEEILNEYMTLRNKFDTQNEKIDDCEQKLYSLNQSYNIVQKTNIEIGNENEILVAENKNLSEKIKSLEAQLLIIKREHEREIDSTQQIIANHQIILDNYVKNSEKDRTDPNVTKQIQNLENENDNLSKELFKTKTECEQLIKNIGDLNLEIKQNRIKFQQLENQWHNLNEEHSELKHILEYKDEQLSSGKITEESLQEEVAILRTQLDQLKCDSAHAAKGNSLFGEVNESRKQLQKKLALMKQLYLDMKSKYSFKVQENLKLTNHNVILSRQMEEETLYRSNTEYSWRSAHEHTIQDLKTNIDFLNDEIRKMNNILIPKTAVNDQWLTSCVSDLFERNKQILLETQEKLNKKIFNDLALSQCLHEAQQEVLKWRSKTSTAETKVQELLLEMESIKIDKAMSEEELEVIEISDDSDLNISENKENFNLTSMLSSTSTSFQNLDISEYDSFKSNNDLELKNKNESIEFKENQTNILNTQNIQHQDQTNTKTDNKNSTPISKPRRVPVPRTRFIKSVKPK